MGGKTIYYAIIILGVGAISYMYFLSDAGSKASLSDDLDAGFESLKSTQKIMKDIGISIGEWSDNQYANFGSSQNRLIAGGISGFLPSLSTGAKKY